MGTPLSNKIVTRGFGSLRTVPNRAGPVVQGFSPTTPAAIVAALVQLRPKPGQSGTKRRLQDLDEVIIWAKLVSVNDIKPKQNVEGRIHVQVKDTSRVSVMAEHVGSRVRSAMETIKVFVTRIK